MKKVLFIIDNVIVYRYDDSGDDYNYVDVDIIIDIDDMFLLMAI